MTVHKLKTLPHFFQMVKDGLKGFEIRRDDRGFAVGDQLLLKEWKEWDEKTVGDFRGYTGRECLVRVLYILREFPGLSEGYCVLSVIPEEEIDPGQGEYTLKEIRARSEALMERDRVDMEDERFRTQKAADIMTAYFTWTECAGHRVSVGTSATVATETGRRAVEVVASKPGFVMFGTKLKLIEGSEQ